MSIPDFQTLMLPVLRRLAIGQRSTTELISDMASEFALSESERTQLLPTRRQPVIANRVHWSLSYLGRAKLIERISRGVYHATDRGKGVLTSPPPRIDVNFLRQFPEFAPASGPDISNENSPPDTLITNAETLSQPDQIRTPEEILESAFASVRADLTQKLLQRMLDAPPALFERLVIDLLLAMGYGTTRDAGEVRGQSGDGGIDGVIREDRLGLDLIYVQAKRYKTENTIGPEQIRGFAGALDFHGARKGVFITTTRFTPEAKRFATQLQTKRIVLVDGSTLTSLMIEHGVGLRPKGEPFIVQEIDLNYFEPEEGA